LSQIHYFTLNTFSLFLEFDTIVTIFGDCGEKAVKREFAEKNTFSAVVRRKGV